MQGVLFRVAFLFLLLAVLFTWPQAVRFDSIPPHHDAYFSLWRLGWIAHALPSGPAGLFDANIFHPERNTLAYSDAVLFEGLLALPFIRAGVPIVYAYNGLVLASFVACGTGMFLLVHRLTGAALPALLAALVFAFTPYRFDHYIHLELLWAAWMPLAFWMVHRTVQTGQLRHGLAVGALVVLQVLSSIYYGVFLCTALLVFTAPLLWVLEGQLRRRALVALAAGGLLAVALVAPYTVPYWDVRDRLGERKAGEALLHAAGPSHYLATMPDNRLEGRFLGGLGRPEKRLFPGIVALLLSAVALWPPVSRTTVAYAIVLAVAVNLSFGPRGLGFDWLREYVPFYRGLRAPARFGQVALLAFAVLTALGCVRVQALLTSRRLKAHLVVAALLLVACAEYITAPLSLTPVATASPAVYQWLREQPPGVVAEFPMPTPLNSPLHEARYQFMSTFHWRPLVNGYSGDWSDAHVRFLQQVAGFPDDAALRALRDAGVTYVLVHQQYLGSERYGLVREQLRLSSVLEQAGRFGEEGFEVAVYRFDSIR